MVLSNSAPASTARVQILTYHGKAFVTGLFWHPLERLTNYMREARQFGRQERMDIVAIRQAESIIQAGFVARSAGAVKGMYSLAAALAGQLGNSWIAAWKVSSEDDRYALVAVYEGAIIPGSDRVDTAAEIQKRVAQLLSRSINFDHTYLPEEFGRGGTPLDIEDLLQPKNLHREYRLRPLAFGLSQGEVIRLSLASAALAGALLGWQQWQAHNARLAHEAAMAAELQRERALAELNQHTKQAQTLQALEHPWAKRPGTAEFVKGCNNAIDKLNLSIKGWTFTAAQCDGQLMSATYKRTGNSTSNDFIAATIDHFSDSPAFFDDGNSAALKMTLSLELAGDDALDSADAMLAKITSWLHAQSLAPSIKELPVELPTPAALPGQPPPEHPPAPDWKHYELQFTSTLPPSIALDGVPSTGLRLREIKTQLQNDRLTWAVTGDLYAK